MMGVMSKGVSDPMRICRGRVVVFARPADEVKRLGTAVQAVLAKLPVQISLPQAGQQCPSQTP